MDWKANEWNEIIDKPCSTSEQIVEHARTATE